MKKIDKSKKFLIVGLGLLGGCYAMALKKNGYFVSAITKDQDDIDYAISQGIIDCGSTNVEKELIENADIIVFALYPHTFVEWIKTFGDLINSTPGFNMDCIS